jgi:hypothetical protein
VAAPRDTKPMRRPAALQVLGAVYLIWRALRSLNSGWNYFYSIPFWCAVPQCHALAPARMPACPPACMPGGTGAALVAGPQSCMLPLLLPPTWWPHVFGLVC